MNAAVVERKDQVPAISEPATLLAIISRAASDPTVDIDKMERLMAMHERMTAKQAEAAFSEALTAAQSEMGRISADATNPQTRSQYATYGKIDKVLRPIYTKHGFALSFDEGDAPIDSVLVLCHVSHKAGHSRTYRKLMPADGKGAKGGDVMTKTHASGAAMSYGMRYLLKGIFNVAIGEEDKDGNAPPGDAKTITEKQVADIQALMTEVKANEAQFKKLWKITSLDQILACNYDTVVQLLQAKRR